VNVFEGKVTDDRVVTVKLEECGNPVIIKEVKKSNQNIRNICSNLTMFNYQKMAQVEGRNFKAIRKADCQKSKFLSKIEILVKNRNSCQKSKFLSKIEILVKNRNSCQKIEILVKNQNSCQKLEVQYVYIKLKFRE